MRASRVGWLPRESADGLLLGVGLTVCAAMVAFVGSDFEFAGAAVLTTLGAVAIAGGGALGLRTRRAPEARLPRQVIAAIAAGAALGLSPLVVGVAAWEGSALLTGEWGNPPVWYLEVLVAGVAAILALLVLVVAPRARLHAAGALFGMGALLTLHTMAVVAHVAGERVGDVRVGGPLGVAGGLLLVAAALSILRAERPANAPAATGVPAT